MIFAVSMTSGVDHDRLEGGRDAIIPRMSQMLNVTIEEVLALLLDAENSGSLEFHEAENRAWIRRVH